MRKCVTIGSMEKKNYQKELEKIIESFGGERKSLLLHACCAPCSSYVLEYLSRYFDITILFYNPNIHPRAEYEKRLREQQRLIAAAFPAVKLVTTEYDAREYYCAVAGCEHLGENSERCYRCYAFRMKKAAAMAEGYDYFTTTLSISPYKHAEWINALGAQLEAESEAKYLPADFKKKGGYQRSIELCKAYDIYRQDYCGCIFSRGESRKKIRHGEQKT